MQNNPKELYVHSEYYEYNFKNFLNNLCKANADYWANWFEEIFENDFKITEIRIKELLSLNESQYELTITETSSLLLERQKGTKFFNETRLILLGNKGSGKTSFARRFEKLDARMAYEKESTPGVDFIPIKASAINPKYTGELDFIINIWDFAGHTVTHAAHKFFLSNRAVYVIVFRGRTENGNTSINEWLEHITYYTDNSNNGKIKVYILVNKSDDNIPQPEYDAKYDEKFEIETHNRVMNLFADNEQGGLLDKFHNDIVDYIVNSPQSRDIPVSISNIKNKIEAEFKGISNVSKTKIKDIIKEYIPDSNTEDILHILHSYGICFYYNKLKGDDDQIIQAPSIVLNPRWVTYAIYRLINFINNDQINNPRRKDGHIRESEYETAFSAKDISDGSYIQKPQITKHHYPFISALAQTFDLAYKKNDLLIFPNCLPENYPDKNRGLGNPDERDFFLEVTTTNIGHTTVSSVTFPHTETT